MKYFFTIIALTIPLTIFSQNIRFSLIGEPQISWFATDDDGGTGEGAVPGLNAGLSVDYFFADNYAFSTGIFLNNTGGKLRYNDSLKYNSVLIPPISIIRYRLKYLTLPVGLKFKTDEIGYATYFANLGINPMVRVNAKATDDKEILYKENISEETRLFNLAYFFSIGAEYSLGGSTALIGGLGYSSGFTDIIKDSGTRATTKSFTIRVGVLF